MAGAPAEHHLVLHNGVEFTKEEFDLLCVVIQSGASIPGYKAKGLWRMASISSGCLTQQFPDPVIRALRPTEISPVLPSNCCAVHDVLLEEDRSLQLGYAIYRHRCIHCNFVLPCDARGRSGDAACVLCVQNVVNQNA